MKKIPLTKGQYALVDDEDFEALNRFKWCALKKKGVTFYAIRIVQKNNKKKAILMHRLILNINDPKIQVDHKDHNGLNNRRNNIRPSTAGQNSCNKSSRKGSSSKYKGVSWHKLSKSWKVQITKDGKGFVGGYFKKEESAALAYNNLAIKLHGEFAFLNKIM